MSSGPTSRFSRILRSSSFRLAALYASVFMVSSIVLFATVYLTATRAMQSDMQAVLRSEAFQLAETHRRAGLAGLANEITRRMNFRTRGPIYYLLQAPTRQVVVGNLPGMPPVNGVIDFVQPHGFDGYEPLNGGIFAQAHDAHRAASEFLEHFVPAEHGGRRPVGGQRGGRLRGV